MKAMRAKASDVDTFRGLVLRPEWHMEPRLIGIRTLVHIDDGVVSWTDRDGVMLTNPPGAITGSLAELPGHITLDGVLVDEYGDELDRRLVTFDLPRFGRDLHYDPLRDRVHALELIVTLAAEPELQVVDMVHDKAAKTSMIHHMLSRPELGKHQSGLMLKHEGGTYTPGTTNDMTLRLDARQAPTES